MYLIEKVQGIDSVLMTATMPEPFGPGWTTEDAEQADALEIWGTRFSESDADYVEYRLMKEGAVIKTRRTEGY